MIFFIHQFVSIHSLISIHKKGSTGKDKIIGICEVSAK